MSEHTTRCDFCRLPVPGEPVTDEVNGEDYEFCSRACRDRLAEAEYVFSEYHGHRRFQSGVDAVDASLPQGVPRNAFVLLSGEPGARESEVHAELVWHALKRGEPAVIVSFQEPPGALVQDFLTFDWNVLPYLEEGQLHIVDCFTHRMDDRDRMFDRMDEWNAHLYDVAEEATTTVRDPSNVGEVSNKLDNALEAREMVDEGLVLVDSLTEMGTLLQPVQAYDFVKDLRADVCKGRYVPVFAGATRAGELDTFPHDLGYVADGIVELRLNDELVENTLIKQGRVRKMSGVLVIPEWHPYEYTSGTGMVLFDPAEEMAKSREERADEEAEGTTVPTTDGADSGEEPQADGNPSG